MNNFQFQNIEIEITDKILHYFYKIVKFFKKTYNEKSDYYASNRFFKIQNKVFLIYKCQKFLKKIFRIRKISFNV